MTKQIKFLYLPEDAPPVTPRSMCRVIDMLAVRGFEVRFSGDCYGWNCVIRPDRELAAEWHGLPIAKAEMESTMFSSFGVAVCDWSCMLKQYEDEIERLLRMVGE